MKSLLKVFALAVGLAVALAAATPALAGDKASLRLNGLHYGFRSFFHLGVVTGFCPGEAIAALAKIKPDLDRALAIQQLNAGLSLVRAEGGAGQPIGWMNPAE